MEPSVFYGGDASDLGHVHRLAPSSFRQLVDQVLNIAVTLNVTRAQYAALDHAKRQKAKRVPYVTPCTFEAETSERHVELAHTITLICIDIDVDKKTGAVPALPYYNSPETLGEQLMPFNFAVYTTASSTPKAPRLRILVEAAHLPPSRYREAVLDIASRIGLATVTKESFTVHQPSYLPTIFKGETQHPLLLAETGGRAYTEADILNGGEEHQGGDGVGRGKGEVAGNVDDLDYLRPIVEEITLQDAAAALKHLDADCTYPEWLEIAAALRHQFPSGDQAEEAYKLFDEWSSKGAKYVDEDDTRAKWRSLKPNPRGRAPVTIRTLLTRASAAGWDANPTKARCYATTLAWIKSAVNDATAASTLITEGLRKIAATPLLTVSEEEALMQEIMMAARRTNPPMKVGVPVLRKDLRRLKAREADQKRGKERLPEWCKGLTYVAKMNEFLRPSTQEYFSPEALDRVYGSKLLPTEDQLKESGDQSMSTKGRPVLRPQDYLLNIVQIPTAYDTLYDPRQHNDTFVVQEGKTYVNTYIRNYPEPDPLRMDEARAVFEEHLGNLIAEEEYRATVRDFLAFIVQNPGAKIRWAILLQGAEGCGKTYLSEVLSAVLGRQQVIALDNDAVSSSYNDWAYGHQVVSIEEIRVAGQNRHEIMNKLKPLITNTTITVNRKFYDTRNVFNNSNYLLFTNHHDALALNDGSRRYFVLKSPIQTKAQIEAMGGEAYFDRIFNALEANAPGLRAYLEQHPISPSFKPNGRAPVTTYLQQLIQDGASDTTASMRNIVEDSLQPLVRDDLLSSTTLMQMLEGQGLSKVTAQHLASVLREDGWVRIGRFTLNDGQKHPLWIKADSSLSTDAAVRIANTRLAQCEGGDAESLL